MVRRFEMEIRVALLTLVATILSSSLVQADIDPSIIITIEEPRPVEEAAYSGIANLRGWAVAPSAIERIEVDIDDKYAFNVPTGGYRSDVAANFPDYSNSEVSGFSMAFNYKDLSPGTHSLTVRAFSSNGDHNEQTVVFSAIRFVSSYISHPAEIDFTTAQEVYVGERAFEVKGVTVEGKTWDIGFIWDPASQAMEIMSIKEIISD